ncbi:MAG: glutamine--fructose-6-phosphate transaminase (isomerizing) [Candidatus Brennerbacteria bacterium]|nr:glutamine--fructose-6-phosphate transaminase (isomerizing) [Candidatus Brennerbacteria bacterium]
MCGIAGYIGYRKSLPVVLESLKRLEYRGYDSAGVAFFDQNGGVRLVKAKSRITGLEKKLNGFSAVEGSAVIGHTRWATHGAPNEKNAHPHSDCSGRIFIVHNGIIENYRSIKADLIKRGHQFISDTDTEAIPHLIEENLKSEKNFKKAFDAALGRLVGAYALAAFDVLSPKNIYIARLGSPLVVGLKKEECLVASDPGVLSGKFKKVIFLKDGQRGIINLNNSVFYPKSLEISRLDSDFKSAKLANFPYFMLQEIFESPEVIKSALQGRLLKNNVKLGGLEQVADKLKKIKRLKIIACGTSYYAGLLGECFFEELAGLPSEVFLASEWRYKKEPREPQTACVFISQSGETADTLAALRKAKKEKYLCLGVVNAVGSSIARETDAGVYNHAGPEIAVASTKAFISQAMVLILMALFLRQLKSKSIPNNIFEELDGLPDKIKSILKNHLRIKSLARKHLKRRNFLFLGRGYNYPAALEGALKLKEIAYVHAEGYAAGEMKHGPIALISKNFPTIAIAVRNNGTYEKILSNLEEIKSRGGPIIAVATQGDKLISKIAGDVFYIPAANSFLEPLLAVVPLQLFAYYFGTLLGYDVDKPRNLAKSVTVE